MSAVETNHPNHHDQSNGPIVIGVIGGVASGKSAVTEYMESRGAQVVYADKIAHEVLNEKPIVESLVHSFGPDIASETPGHIARDKLAKIVFGNSQQAQENRQRLEAIVHPRIRQMIRDRLKTLRQIDGLKWIVLDIPLLIESGWTADCDQIWFIDTADDRRKLWAEARGWSAEQWRSREASQLPLEQKRNAATHRIPNDEDLDVLKCRIDTLLANETV